MWEECANKVFTACKLELGLIIHFKNSTRASGGRLKRTPSIGDDSSDRRVKVGKTSIGAPDGVGIHTRKVFSTKPKVFSQPWGEIR